MHFLDFQLFQIEIHIFKTDSIIKVEGVAPESIKLSNFNVIQWHTQKHKSPGAWCATRSHYAAAALWSLAEKRAHSRMHRVQCMEGLGVGSQDMVQGELGVWQVLQGTVLVTGFHPPCILPPAVYFNCDLNFNNCEFGA